MEKLKAIDVKGKNYVMVNERLKYFREHFEGYALISDIIEITPDRVCILAKILDGNGSVKATGIAFEEKQSSYINKTSYIENCETSAWGRALANFGIGIDENVSSADEVAHAIEIQEEQEKSAAKKNNKKSETQKTDKNSDPKPQSPADEKAVDELSNDVTKMLIDEVIEKAARTGTDIRAICQCANKADLSEFTAANCQNALKILNKKLRKLEAAQK
jgi:hypothetical protein